MAVLCLLTTGTLFAQNNSGRISGTITDHSGSVIAGATVTVANRDTKVTEKVTTETNGYFVVPTNSNVGAINFQVYEYCPVAADNPQADLTGAALDSVYWDDMLLIQVLPVTNLTATVSGGNVNLSFSAGAGLNYSVLYKTNLTDPAWNVLAGNVAAPLTWQTNVQSVGLTYPVTVSDSVSGQHNRFYKVQSH